MKQLRTLAIFTTIIVPSMHAMDTATEAHATPHNAHMQAATLTLARLHAARRPAPVITSLNILQNLNPNQTENTENSDPANRTTPALSDLSTPDFNTPPASPRTPLHHAQRTSSPSNSRFRPSPTPPPTPAQPSQKARSTRPAAPFATLSTAQEN